jgi:hypothetical protein
MSAVKWEKDELEGKVGEFVEQCLEKWMDQPWNEDENARLSKDISKFIVNNLYSLNANYKYSAVCVICKKNQYNPKVESACVWDPEADLHVSICRDTYHFFCILNILAISLDN